MYSSMSASFIAPAPLRGAPRSRCRRRNRCGPGASPFNVAKAFAVTAAIRFDGTNTPVPRRIFEVFTAAAAIAAKQSAVIICVS